ncbi:alpha/beta hydrolase [Rossellomorea vietnamensis]|uniref:Alpha/beta hydrolase n=1 Tax=Rossellomorea vietnamensis TaxID=218284 RepID=A0A5D4KAH5_9BACI|nr:alpha/beta hydrolase [Rossellomorea vietnamensis]TYR73700.1 alpha/beta hydrolase [Rossellomorea vietnamensis]
MKRYFIENGTMPIHITEWGSENDSVIFCLHGLGSTSLSFIDAAEELKDGYRIISVDAPGHGKTPPFAYREDYEMPRMAEWINDIINLLNIEQFYFLSHSWGSFVHLFYLRNYSHRVKGSILIDGGYQSKRHSGKSAQEEMDYYREDFEQTWANWEEFRDLVKSETQTWTPHKELAAEDLSLKKDNRYYWHARGTTGANIIRAMHKDDVEDIFDSMPPGILLLRATLPEMMEEDRKLKAERFQDKTGAEVISVSGASHLLHWDKPEVVIEEVKKRWPTEK